MKLIFCPKCEDVVRLRSENRICVCGASGGYYIDNLLAEFYGNAIPLGFDNASFTKAIKTHPKKTERGVRFEAFVISEGCDTFTRRKEARE